MAEEPAFIIDGNMRAVTIPEGYDVAGVESDKDVNRIRFECPRFIDGTDLSQFSIYINYLNANGDGDIHIVQDMEASDDTLEFSWLVGKNALAYAGILSFVVCMILHKADGITIDREFNTTIAQVRVLRGLEVAAANEMDYYDALAKLTKQWRSAADALVSAKLDAFDSASSAKLSQYDSEVSSKLDEVPGLVENAVGDSLSNLSGFVNKTGDTMTGDLGITGSSAPTLKIISTTADRHEVLNANSSRNADYIEFYDKNADSRLASICGSLRRFANDESQAENYEGLTFQTRGVNDFFIGRGVNSSNPIIWMNTPGAWISALGIKDFVVDSGTSGSWKYVKYSNGYVICWTSQTVSNAAVTYATGNLFRTQEANSISFPFEFAENPTTSVDISSSTGGVIAAKRSAISKTSLSFNIYSAVSTTMSPTVGIVAFGKWK